MRRGLRVLAILVVVFGLFVLVGCQAAVEKAAEEAIQQTTGVSVDQDGDKVTIEGEDGSTVEMEGSDSEIPEGLPESVPVYDADVDSASSIAADGMKSFYINLVTNDAVDGVISWHSDEYGKAGWTINADSQFESDGIKSGMLSATKDDMQSTVSVSETENGSVEIAYIVNVPDK